MGLVAFNDTGPLALGSLGRLTIGGAESNVAIGVARLGHRSGWIGRVGDDTVGRLVRTTLLAEGVDARGVATDPGVATGLMLREHRTFSTGSGWTTTGAGSQGRDCPPSLSRRTCLLGSSTRAVSTPPCRSQPATPPVP